MRVGVARRIGLLVGILALVWAGCFAAPARADGTVELVYFYDEFCSSCAEVHQEVLEPLVQQYGDQLRVVEVEIGDDAGLELLLALEQEHSVYGGEIPEVFIGDQEAAFELTESVQAPR